MRGHVRFALAAALLLAVGSAAQGQSVVAVSMSPQSLIGGNPSTGAVRLNVAAPSGGAVVSLASSDTAAAAVPASVTVAAGATIAHFAIATFGVSSTHFPVITATLNGSATQTMQVWRAYISSVGLSASAVIGSNPVTGTVYLNGAAPPGGLDCTLSSSNAAAAQAPGDVVVAAGARTATFTVTTTPVVSNKSLTIYATALGSTRGVGFTVLVTHVTSVTVDPSSVPPTVSSTATVTLAAPAPAGGLTCDVSLSGPIQNYFTWPATVTVPAGATTATFVVTAHLVDEPFDGSINVTAYGSTRTAFLGNILPQIVSWSVSPSPVHGGGKVTVTVTLAQPHDPDVNDAPAPGQDLVYGGPDPWVGFQWDSSNTVGVGSFYVGYTTTTINTYVYFLVAVTNTPYTGQNPTTPLTILP